MAFKSKIFHMTYTQRNILNKSIKAKTTHMKIRVKLDDLPQRYYEEVKDRSGNVTIKDCESTVVKILRSMSRDVDNTWLTVIVSIGPKKWVVRTSTIPFCHMTEAYVNSDYLNAILYGAVYNNEQSVITDGIALEEGAAIEFVRNMITLGKASFDKKLIEGIKYDS